MESTAKICWQYEDEIGITIGPEMFRSSRIIDGVRMYPYVSMYGNIFYLWENDLATEVSGAEAPR